MSLPVDDPRHGTNGYFNLGCRCGICRMADEFKAYAARKGESMRQIGLKAVAEYMERHP